MNPQSSWSPSEPDEDVGSSSASNISPNANQNWQPPEADEGHFSHNVNASPVSNSAYENYMAGFGKSAVDLGAGIGQRGLEALNYFGIVPQSTVSKFQEGIDERHKLDKPLMSTPSGIAGNITGNTLPMLYLPGAGIRAAAFQGAGLGALQPTESNESVFQNSLTGGLGGAGGAALGKAASAVVNPFGGISPERNNFISILNNAMKSSGAETKFPLTVAQRTGAKTPRLIENASSLLSDKPAEFAATQSPSFNRIVLNSIGETKPNSNGVYSATSDVLSRANERIGGVMDDVAGRTNFPLISEKNSLFDQLAKMEEDLPKISSPQDYQPIMRNINDLVEGASKNNGIVDGNLLQNVYSNLGTLAKNKNHHAGDLREILNDFVTTNASKEDAEALMEARRHYRALKQIEPAIDPLTGNINPDSLFRSMTQKSNVRQNLYSKGDQNLMDIAKSGKAILGDKLGGSSLSERLMPINMWMALASGDPYEMAKAGIGALTGKVGFDSVGSALRNQNLIGNYLSEGVPGLRNLAPALEKSGKALGRGVMSGMAGSNNNPIYQPPSDQNPQAYGGRIVRASGGRADRHEHLVGRLMKMADSAKKISDQTTETFLNAPDESIVKALAVAKKGI